MYTFGGALINQSVNIVIGAAWFVALSEARTTRMGLPDCGKMHTSCFSVGAQGFSSAKIPANSRGF